MEGATVERFGMDSFRIDCLGVQDAWALTVSPAPQKDRTPLHLALPNPKKAPLPYGLTKSKAEVVKILRDAGARS